MCKSALKEPLENPVQMEGSFMVLAEILHMEVLTLHPENVKFVPYMPYHSKLTPEL